MMYINHGEVCYMYHVCMYVCTMTGGEPIIWWSCCSGAHPKTRPDKKLTRENLPWETRLEKLDLRNLPWETTDQRNLTRETCPGKPPTRET